MAVSRAKIIPVAYASIIRNACRGSQLSRYTNQADISAKGCDR